MPRRRLGGISSRSSHSLNSGNAATPVAESALAESVEAKPEPESALVEPEPEPESVEAKPESTTPVIGVSSVDDIIDVDK